MSLLLAADKAHHKLVVLTPLARPAPPNEHSTPKINQTRQNYAGKAVRVEAPTVFVSSPQAVADKKGVGSLMTAPNN